MLDAWDHYAWNIPTSLAEELEKDGTAPVPLCLLSRGTRGDDGVSSCPQDIPFALLVSCSTWLPFVCASGRVSLGVRGRAPRLLGTPSDYSHKLAPGTLALFISQD